MSSCFSLSVPLTLRIPAICFSAPRFGSCVPRSWKRHLRLLCSTLRHSSTKEPGRLDHAPSSSRTSKQDTFIAEKTHGSERLLCTLFFTVYIHDP
ncbi:hypothetical protein BD310DRAFT_936772 [Dichomitus squalens]|uniref:Uncharacterized protein n=1 Tax=Dichomitus squalens TaxID=114155 RepID=A0A4Q9PJ00_9APHY|nr:hypothetical protein BD310DRAFT_936772 [Dichomitus squalens]